jgi:phenylacetate-CoA ligase
MNKQFLKTFRDIMPESLKYIAAPIIRNSLIKNKEFSSYIKLLEKREKVSPDRIKEYQLAQLKLILNHSYQNVPYYRELFDKVSFNPAKFSDFEEIKKIPFLTKELIRENYNNLISTREIENGFYATMSGGSTGEPLKLLLDYNSVFRENAFIYYFRKKAGYRYEDKLVTFRGIEFGDKFWKINPIYNELIISPFKLSKFTLESYVTKINNYNPQYLNGYLSSIYFFAKLLDEHQLRLTANLKGIFLISENLDNRQRRFVDQFFNLKSMSFYGHTERCVIAEEIHPYGYKFDPYYGFTERIQVENNSYSIVGTGFLSYTMPFIRYLTDDICIPCNGYFSIKGKRISTIGLVGKNDEYFGQAAFNFHSDIFKNVSNYQFVQNEKGKADLLIIVNEDFKISEIDVMQKEIARKTEGIIEFNIKVVDRLILTTAGKFNMFISEIK